jgi:glucose-1-phosphate cytidylyltransferase
VEIRGLPILWHVISISTVARGSRASLLTGYEGEQIESWSPRLFGTNGVEVDCLDTGLNTSTGGRIKLAPERIGDELFSATYANGVGDIDVRELVDFQPRRRR